MLLDYLLPTLQDSIITGKVRAINHYLGKFQSQDTSQSEQLLAIWGYWRTLRDVDTSKSKGKLR